MTRRRFLQGFGLGVAAAGLTAGYGDLLADDLRLEQRDVTLPRWDADGFRVAVLADLHVNLVPAVARARRAAEMAIHARPDLIVVLGDFITTSRRFALEHIRQALEPLHDAGCPCLGVMGNHDYWSEQPRRIIDALKETPMRLLRNESVELGGVEVAGIDDALAGRHDTSFLNEGRHSRSLIILLHEPDYVEEMPEQASLQLSGHSHGGQMCLPFGVPIRLPKGARRYASGLYPDAKVPLYVSRGVGTIGPDLRLFCPPEVSVLTLRSGS